MTPRAWACFADTGNCIIWSTDEASVRSKTPIVKRQREKHEAMPLTSSVWTPGFYLTGDGEVRQLQRPGSHVAAALPSRGYRT